MKFVIASALMATLVIVVQAEYPANFPKCKNADEPCLVKAANEVIQNHYSGVPELDLPAFDPLHIKSMLLRRNPSSPVNIEIKLSDLEVEGFKTMKVSNFQGLKADLSGRNSMSGIIEHLGFKGHYIVDGKVLVLPITGEGTCRFTCKNIRFNYSFDLKPVEKDGATYVTLKHVKLVVEPEHVEFIFDNLFDGDKALTETANEFVNANWKEIYNEVQSDLSKHISLLVKSMLSGFLKKYPYADYFLQEEEK